MFAIFRFFLEWSQPFLRCRRLGHRWRQIEVRGFVYPSSGFGSVADEVVVSIHQCGCCRKRKKWANDAVIYRDSIQSLTMSSDNWRTLKERGFLER